MSKNPTYTQPKVELVDEYGNVLELKHYAGHDLLELTAPDTFVFRAGSEEEAKKLAKAINTWVHRKR